ncbi:MAG: multifunctional CCA tRNA nucleotidyl transferase/2'3'-cyclic phosphodiesterase/2'nucleotidase/phosphatase [Gammaproteobacteria bacterium]|nr:multifunctional CCA tRNA nucleotidyl transferase/2'3'-cyclic phosphodiesterase/2'nucleotidase/phosphatase [Gammaproteobacteria bacterium]
MKIYLVGGAVRDKLLGLSVKERDYVVVGATPEEMTAKGFKPVGKDFPVFLHPKTHEQYALARTERKIRAGYQGFQFNANPSVTLEEDLKRRDLTINAMAETSHGKLIDLFGGGDDLKARVLRHVSPSFVEDPVRVLRVARFAARYHALGFKVAEETLLLMKRMGHLGEVDALVMERVWQEFETALREPHPEQFILVLRQCEALGKIFPELEALFSMPVGHDSHERRGESALRMLQQAVRITGDPVVRFAALVFECGFLVSTQSVETFSRSHALRRNEKKCGQGEGIEAKEAATRLRTFCRRICAPRLYGALALLGIRYYFFYVRAAEKGDAEEIYGILEKLDAFRRPERFFQFLNVCCAIGQGIIPSRDATEAVHTFRAAFQAGSVISAQHVKDKSLSGSALGNAIRALRIEAIGKL